MITNETNMGKQFMSFIKPNDNCGREKCYECMFCVSGKTLGRYCYDSDCPFELHKNKEK